MSARLYVIPGSHPCRTGMLMLEHKQIPYRTITLPTGMHPVIVRALGFPGHPTPIRSVDGGAHGALALLDRLGTVPALSIAGQRVQTSRRIARFLDELQPDPPLFPADAAARAEVEEAEAWGDEALQMAARRLALAAAARGIDQLHDRARSGRLGPLLAFTEPKRRLDGWIAARVAFRANADTERALLAELPAMLDRVDAWIERGVLAGADLYAADYMIAPSLALLSYRKDLSGDIEARPAGALMERILPMP